MAEQKKDVGNESKQSGIALENEVNSVQKAQVKARISCSLLIFGLLASAISGALLYYMLDKYTKSGGVFGGFVGIFIYLWILIAREGENQRKTLVVSSAMIAGGVLLSCLPYLQGFDEPLLSILLELAPIGAFVTFILLSIVLMLVPDTNSKKQNQQSDRAIALAEILINDSGNNFNKTLDEIQEFSNRGDRIGLEAIEESIKKISGNSLPIFFEPGKSILTDTDIELDQSEQLIELASKGLLLKDVYRSGKLIMAFTKVNGDADKLHEAIVAAGGPEQEKAFVLLQNHLKCYAHSKRFVTDSKTISCTRCNFKGNQSEFKTAILMGDVSAEMYGDRVLACPECGAYLKKIGSIL